MRTIKPEYLLALCGAFLIGLTAIGLTLPQPVIGQFGIRYGRQLDYFVILACVQGLIYFAAVMIMLRSRASARIIWIILGCAAILRVMVVVFPPFLSNDLYRYIWDGWVQAAGINPYRYIPVDPHLAFLRDTVVFPNINRADYAHTIYPPAAEMIFFAVTRIAALLAIPPVLAMKLAMVTFEGIGIWGMIRLLDLAGLPHARVLIYAWNPLPVWEFAGSGHVDAIGICFIALAMLAVCKSWHRWGASALAAAVLTKFLPIVLLPLCGGVGTGNSPPFSRQRSRRSTRLISALAKPCWDSLTAIARRKASIAARAYFCLPFSVRLFPCRSMRRKYICSSWLWRWWSRARSWCLAGRYRLPRGADTNDCPALFTARLCPHGRTFAALPMVLLLAADPGLHPAVVERTLFGDRQLPALSQPDPYGAVLAGLRIRTVLGSSIAGRMGWKSIGHGNEPAIG